MGGWVGRIKQRVCCLIRRVQTYFLLWVPSEFFLFHFFLLDLLMHLLDLVGSLIFCNLPPILPENLRACPRVVYELLESGVAVDQLRNRSIELRVGHMTGKVIEYSAEITELGCISRDSHLNLKLEGAGC